MKKSVDNLSVSALEHRAAGLYVHVPYCTSKCPYCDFNSVAVTGANAQPFDEERFINCLCTELDSTLNSLNRTSFNPATLYFGGGTPSLLSSRSVLRFIEHVKRKGNGALPDEVTLEANPESLTPEKLSGYLEAGVNRLSLGIQSLNPAELKQLGRPHTAAEGKAAFRAARGAGFKNIGVDIIFALPEHVSEEAAFANLKESLRVVELAPEHISLYGLTIEEATPFHTLYSGASVTGSPEGRGAALTVDDELYASLYSYAIEALSACGYVQYEISNFSLPGFRSRHNSLYWNGTEYLGLGPGAQSLFYDTRWGRRSSNVKGVQEYFKMVERAGRAVEETEVLDRSTALLEAVMLGLRRVGDGIRGAEFKARFGTTPYRLFNTGGNADRLIEQGLLCRAGEDLKLTAAGVLLADSVITEL